MACRRLLRFLVLMYRRLSPINGLRRAGIPLQNTVGQVLFVPRDMAGRCQIVQVRLGQ